GEVNGESTQDQRPNNSALLGVIWQPTSKNVFLDAGIRRGISRAAPDWQFTIGLTFGFSLPTLSRQGARAMASPTARRFSTRRDSVRLSQQVQGSRPIRPDVDRSRALRS